MLFNSFKKQIFQKNKNLSEKIFIYNLIIFLFAKLIKHVAYISHFPEITKNLLIFKYLSE